MCRTQDLHFCWVTFPGFVRKFNPCFHFPFITIYFFKCYTMILFCNLFQLFYQAARTWIRKTNQEWCNHLYYVSFYINDVEITKTKQCVEALLEHFHIRSALPELWVRTNLLTKASDLSFYAHFPLNYLLTLPNMLLLFIFIFISSPRGSQKTTICNLVWMDSC